MHRLMPAVVACFALAACTHVGEVRNLHEASCGTGFERELASILVAEKESPEAAAALAARTRAALADAALGPRPFALAAPSGTDYHFIVEPTREGCWLRLYGRRRGFTTLTNNLTWIASRALPGCECSEGAR